MNDWLDAESRIERVLQLAEAQQWTEALGELEAAIAINPNDPSWHAQRGQILDQIERYDEAIEAYDQALALAPEQLEIETARAIDLIRIGRYEQAVRVLEEVARARPDYEPAYCHRIAAYTRLGRHDSAEEMFYLAQQIDPDCPNCFHHMAESLACRGLLAKAIYCWHRALEIEPGYPQARERIAEAYRAQKQYDKAREFYLLALRHDPGNTDILAELGDLLIEMDDLPAAAAKFQQVIELAPHCERALVMLGLIASQTGDSDRAVACFEAALKLNDNYPGLRSHLGEAELRRGNHYDALRHLSLALEDDPDDCVGLMAMGNCLFELGRSSEAADYFEHVMDLEPTLAGAHHNLAVCRFLENDFEAGIRHCRDALACDPDNVMVMHKLALACLHLGRWQEAREMIDRGLAADPHHPGLSALPKRFWRLRLRRLLRRGVRRNRLSPG